MEELLKEYRVIIDDEENYIGYVKDIKRYLHNQIEEQVKDWNNYEDSICSMAHTLYELKCNYEDDDLIRISDCPMDEFGIKIEELGAI